MGPAWLFFLLLLPPLLSAQVTPDLPPADPTAETDTPAAVDSLLNGTGTSSSSGSSQASGSVTPPPSWGPAEAYLYSGDASALEQGPCAWAYSFQGWGGPLPPGFVSRLRPAMDALSNTANFLNMIFQASDLREASVRDDMEWYHAMVRALLESDPLARRALLTFDADPSAPVPQLVLRASRSPALSSSPAPKFQSILLQDLSDVWESLHPPSPAPDDSWFTSFKFPAASSNGNAWPASAFALTKRVLLNDLDTLETPKWGRGDSYVTNRSGVRWAASPFLECVDGYFLPGWLLTLSTSFYGLKPDLSPEFRGVIRVDVNIQSFDVDQCSPGDSWFANTHQCNRTSMQCEPITGQGFRLGQYCCRCKAGFYSPPLATQDTQGGGAVNGSSVDDGDDVSGDPGGGGGGGVCYPTLPICLPCWPGCATCEDGAPCWVQEDWVLRAGVLAVQGCFMFLVFFSMLVAFQCRFSRRIRASGLLLLETILFGSLLLYFSVFILYFRPSTFRCILLRWVRMLGFSIVYGTVTLKMYRVLKLFLSRTAQRLPYLSSLHLLRILGIMVITVSWFLCAWTVGILQNRDRHVPLLVTLTTTDGRGFNLCKLDRWDYMMAVAELLFLCWGSFLCSAVKQVPSAFHEPRYMGIAIHNELLISTMFHLLRFSMPSLHPDWMLLLFFTHTHITTTVTLALLFIPKFLHMSRREEIAAEVYEDEVDLRRSGSYLNNSFTPTWSEHSLDPDDIRDELKKLYGQLEVHKTKKMTDNNPHLQKKRSSRKSLGRSIIKRISEIPESMNRRCSRDEKEISFASRSNTFSQSCKRRPSDPVVISNNDEAVKKQPQSVLRKSVSDYDYIRDKDPSLPDSVTWGAVDKRASQLSETNSLDIKPLVCKSASAQNLSVENNLLHPEHNKMQKSKSLGSSRAHSLEDTRQVGRSVSEDQMLAKMNFTTSTGTTIMDQTTSALQSTSYDKAEVCPWELQEEQRPPGKNQKHVTYAPSESDDDDDDDDDDDAADDDADQTSPANVAASPVSTHICPWDHISVESTAVEEECESPRPQAPISSSAPGTPRPGNAKAAMDQRVFSFRNTPNKWLSVKSSLGSIEQGQKEKVEKTKVDILKLMKSKSIASAFTAPKSPNPDNKALQIRSKTMDHKPCLVKQKAIRLPSSDSIERSPMRGQGQQSNVYPWNMEDMQKDGHYENVSISRQSSPSSFICPWEGDGRVSRTGSQSSREMAREDRSPGRTSVQGSICPWEGDGRVSRTGSQTSRDMAREARTPSATRKSSLSVPKVNVCPWDVPGSSSPRRKSLVEDADPPWEEDEQVQVTERAGLGHRRKSQEAVKRRKSQPDVCPWDTGVEVTVPLQNSSVTSQLQQNEQLSLNRKPNVCPWETPGETPHTANRRESCITINICPWDMEEEGHTEKTTCVIYENVPESERLDERRGSVNSNVSGKTLTKQESVYENICPWETNKTQADDQTKSPKPVKAATAKSTALVLPQRQVSVADACPWDVPEPPKNSASLCPWEEETEMSNEEPQTKSTTKESSSSQETSSPKMNICPWETEEEEKTLKKDVNICPWETGETDAMKQQHNVQVNVLKKTEQIIRQDSDKANICPWETGDSEKTEQQDKTKTGISKLPEENTKQDCAQANVCPWETEEKEESVQMNVCPWETGETEKAYIAKETEKDKRECRTKVDVYPLKTAKPEVARSPALGNMRRRDTKVDLCPWEKADLCPWDSGEAVEITRQDSIESNKSKSQDNVRANIHTKVDVCPLETTKVDVCPLETVKSEITRSPAPEHIRRQDSKADPCPWEKADVCPWDSGEPVQIMRQDSIESNKSKSQDNVRANIRTKVDVCALETVKPEVARSPALGNMRRRDTKVDLCPWEKADLCPWDSREAVEITRQDSIESNKSKSQDNVRANIRTKVDVCPLETVKSEITRSPAPEQDSKADPCPWEKADVCPWDSGEPVQITRQDSKESNKSKSQDNLRANIRTKVDVCPLETAKSEITRSPAPEHTRRGNSKPDVCPKEKADVCPWDSEETVEITRQDSKESSKSKSQDNIQDNICPWDTNEPARQDSKDSGKSKSENPNPTHDPKRRGSTKSDLCPWETAKTDTMKKGDSKESMNSNPAHDPKRRGSTKSDLCPWETAKTDTMKKGDSKESMNSNPTHDPKRRGSTRSDLCPWETAKTDTMKKGDSKESMNSNPAHDPKRRGSTRSDLCPWETAKTDTMKKGDSKESMNSNPTHDPKRRGSTRSGLCPWETTETVRASACPWETEEPEPEKTKRRDSKSSVKTIRHDSVTAADTDKPEKSSDKETTLPASTGEEDRESQQGGFIMAEGDNAQPAAGSSTEEEGVEGAGGGAKAALVRRDALCPWDMGGDRQGSMMEQDNNNDVFTWEQENIPEEEDDNGDAESAAEAFVFPSDL